ncbi:hypothetical protein CKO45_11640 [Paracraurococcus ruber]|uniref:VacJ family lipoprotein n=2 Tax=Paracraurococcus ruber TaxID=77675 RepID=A0ABS1CWU9_9PROT|nr:hypothetical protein [Paracraurococcus ruber]
MTTAAGRRGQVGRRSARRTGSRCCQRRAGPRHGTMSRGDLPRRDAGVDPMLRRLAALALLPALILASPGAARAERDPLEPVNRRIHGFNEQVRARVLGPLAEAWRDWTPPGLRQGVANALGTLSEPVSAASGLAAGEFGIAWNAAARFGINATLGWGGVRDRAAEMGYPPRPFTLADALCAWRLPSGPYLVLPLLGPSTLRDAGGLAAQGAALSQLVGSDAFLAWSTTDSVIGYAGLHETLARVAAESLDPYAVLRSAYLQRRAAACPVDRAAPEEDAPDQ